MVYGIRDIIITGDAALTLYETLKKSAGNGIVNMGKVLIYAKKIPIFMMSYRLTKMES